MESLFYSALLLWILTASSTASDLCTELEFTNVTGDTVHATDGDTITLIFKPNISKCSHPPERILIKVKGKYQEYCKVTIDNRICKASDQTSTVCRCVDGSENIQFSMKVDRSSDVVYNWVWSNYDTGTERNRMIRFNVSNSPFSRPVIVGLQTNQVVRVGEDLTLTCVVPCTKSPLSSVNFTCGHRSGSFNRTTGFHTLTFNPLTAADDGAECRCTATWLQDANYFHAEESAVLTVMESEKVVSIPTMIMSVTLSHLVGVLWSGTIFFIILRRKVRPRIRRMRRRRLPPRPNPLCLPTTVAAYDDIPDSWTTSGPPEGITDIMKRKSRSSTGAHVKSWRPLTSSGKPEAAPCSEAPDDQGTMYMYLEPVNQNSKEVTNSQPSSDKSLEDTAHSQCVIEVEVAVAMDDAVTSPEISTSPNVSKTETTSSDDTKSAATSKDATKPATSTPPLEAVPTDVIKSSTAITPAETSSKTAWNLTTVTSTDALKTATQYLQVPETAATSTNATKPAALSSMSRAATPKVTPKPEAAASTDTAKPLAASTDDINPATAASKGVGKLTVVTSSNVSKLIAALLKDDTYSATRSTDDIKRTAFTLRNASKPATAAADVTKPATTATKDVSKPTTATNDTTKPTLATDAIKPSTATTDITKPSTSATDTTKPSTAATDITKPSTSATDTTKPATAAADVTKQLK